MGWGDDIYSSLCVHMQAIAYDGVEQVTMNTIYGPRFFAQADFDFSMYDTEFHLAIMKQVGEREAVFGLELRGDHKSRSEFKLDYRDMPEILNHVRQYARSKSNIPQWQWRLIDRISDSGIRISKLKKDSVEITVSLSKLCYLVDFKIHYNKDTLVDGMHVFVDSATQKEIETTKQVFQGNIPIDEILKKITARFDANMTRNGTGMRTYEMIVDLLLWIHNNPALNNNEELMGHVKEAWQLLQ